MWLGRNSRDSFQGGNCVRRTRSPEPVSHGRWDCTVTTTDTGQGVSTIGQKFVDWVFSFTETLPISLSHPEDRNSDQNRREQVEERRRQLDPVRTLDSRGDERGQNAQSETHTP